MFKIYVLCVLRIYRRLKRKFDKLLKFKVYVFCLFFIFALIPSIYIYICNHENNVPFWLSPQCFVATHALRHMMYTAITD